MNTLTNSFNSYRITYGIVSHNIKDYAKIECYLGSQKQGQILFGSSIAPGNNASQHGSEIHLYFPLEHFSNLLSVLKLGAGQPFSLYLTLGPNNNPETGGISTDT